MARSDARESQREIARMSDELTIRLQVLQESGARPRTRVEAERVNGDSAPSLGGWIGGVNSGADIEALAFLVLMQAAKSAQEDLKAIMAQVKAINAAKAHQREVLQRMQQAAAAAAGRDDAGARGGVMPLGEVSREQNDDDEDEDDDDEERTDAPAKRKPGPPSGAGDLDALIAVLLGVYAIDIEREGRRVLDDLDSMSVMGEMQSLKLQMAMDRMSKMMSTLSNLMKKIADTSAQITQNLK